MQLDTITRKLQAVLTAAATTAAMNVTVDYVDITASALPVAGLTPTNTNGATPVDILAAPAASTVRKVNSITIYNADSAAKTVSVNLDDNGTDYLLVKSTLQVGETLAYTDTRGWYSLDANGNTKVSPLTSMTSAQLAAILSDETGTGAAVFATSPTFITPALGTPASGTLTNCTGLPISTGVAGLAANVATFLATPSSANLAAAITDETGTAGSIVFSVSPTFTGTTQVAALTASALATLNGGASFAAGTVSAPSLYFSTDTATGWYRIGLNNNGYSVNGTKLLDLSAALFAVTGAISATTTGKVGTTISVGNATPAASGAGITFPATQSASSDANTLDDYEEGLHPATITCGTSGTVTLNATNNKLAYTKIGRSVNLSGQVRVDSVSSPVGYFVISTPFAADNLSGLAELACCAITVNGTNAALPTNFLAYVNGATAQVIVYLASGTGASATAANELKAASEITINVTYNTAT